MTTPLPFDRLKQLAQDDVDAAARRLGTTQQQCDEAQRQLQALLDYRREYQDKLQAAAQAGMPAAGWRNFQQFIDTLDTAIARQRQAVAQADAQVADSRHAWQRHRQRLHSFDALAERAAQRERHRANRAEQRDNDEYAARRARSRVHAPPY